MITGSLPLAIGSGDKQKMQQQQQSGPPPRGPPGRRSKLQENKWALRQCTHCRANFIPSTHDSEFCSGDCRLSFSILEQNRAALKK